MPRNGPEILDAVYGSGHGAPSRVYEKAVSHLGITPSTYRRGNAATEIRYGLAATSLGALLVAVTEIGICCVRLGDTEARIEAVLSGEYAAAILARDDSGLRGWIGPIAGSLDGAGLWPELPVDPRGPACERAVWETPRQIPHGARVTHGALAAYLGHPKATRAVANACARNGIALLIPCHRVVPRAGGYRWGPGRKQRFLAIESDRRA